MTCRLMIVNRRSGRKQLIKRMMKNINLNHSLARRICQTVVDFHKWLRVYEARQAALTRWAVERTNLFVNRLEREFVANVINWT